MIAAPLLAALIAASSPPADNLWRPFLPFTNESKTPLAKFSQEPGPSWIIKEIAPFASETAAGLRATNSAPLGEGRYLFEAEFRIRETPFSDGLGYGRMMLGTLDRTQPWIVDFHLASAKNWQKFQVPFRLEKTAHADTLVAQVVSANPGQISEWRALRISSLEGNPDAPLPPPSGITYPGREENASWRVAARERIRHLRMSDLELAVLDKSGNPLPDTDIEIKLLRHDFPFGTAVTAEGILGNTPDDVRYRSEFLRLFNAAVLENDLK